jgi:hypothetical protein
MAWQRNDDHLDEELAFLGHEAFRLYTSSLTYSRRLHRGGRLHVVRDLGPLARKQGIKNIDGAIAELFTETEEDQALWLRDGDYVVIRSYEKYNPLTTTERVRRLRSRRKEQGIDEATLGTLRQQVFARDGYACRYCGAEPEPRWLVADHVIPAPEGPTTMENLVAACRSCNRRKASLSLEESGLQLRPVPSGVTAGVTEVSPQLPSRERPRAGSPVPIPVPVPEYVSPANAEETPRIRLVELAADDTERRGKDDAGVVWEAWCASTGRTGCQFNGKRKRLVRRALQAFPLADLLDAAVGWQSSPFHRGENQQGRVWNDFELIFRDDHHIEQFRDFARGGLTTAPVIPQRQTSGQQRDASAAELRDYLDAAFNGQGQGFAGALA